MIRARVCPGCSMSFKDRQSVLAHIALAHWDQFGGGEERPKSANPLPIQLVKKIFQDTYRLYDVDLSDVEVRDAPALFLSIRADYDRMISDLFTVYRGFKLQFHLKSHMIKDHPDGPRTHRFPYFESFNFVVENDHFSNVAFKTAMDNMDVRIQDWLSEGSGWRLKNITGFQILTSDYRPLMVGANMTLHPILAYKHRNFINVPGTEDSCFENCIIAHFLRHTLDPKTVLFGGKDREDGKKIYKSFYEKGRINERSLALTSVE